MSVRRPGRGGQVTFKGQLALYGEVEDAIRSSPLHFTLRQSSAWESQGEEGFSTEFVQGSL